MARPKSLCLEGHMSWHTIMSRELHKLVILLRRLTFIVFPHFLLLLVLLLLYCFLDLSYDIIVFIVPHLGYNSAVNRHMLLWSFGTISLNFCFDVLFNLFLLMPLINIDCLWSACMFDLAHNTIKPSQIMFGGCALCF
jgi:hypothetical protein